MLAFGDDSDVVTSCAKLRIATIIMAFDLNYANCLAGVRRSVVHINE